MASGGVVSAKAHAVLVPFPAQGHIIPMLKLAKLIHSHGLHVTLVNTDFIHSRLLQSQGGAALAGLPDFRFESIPDGLPPPNSNAATRELRQLCTSILENFLPAVTDLLHRLNERFPRVSHIVYDSLMSFCLDAGRQLGVPVTAFWTASACGLMGYLHFQALLDRGITPFKDESYLTSGCLDEAVDWIPALPNIRLKDLPSFIRTTDPDDIFFNFINNSVQRIAAANAVVVNTFDDLERPVLRALSDILLPPIHTVGPINLLSRRFAAQENPLLKSIAASLWEEDGGCATWLDCRDPRSIVFVNFGSVMVMTKEQLVEFAWGLADSGYDFLWVIRGDLVDGGEPAVLPAEFWEEKRGRGRIVGWCAQEEVLSNPAVGVFVTHAGWNSVLESLCGGVGMVCWPYFAEQQTNCWCACGDCWGVGLEIGEGVRREEVAGLVREGMKGERGREMRRRAKEWKEAADWATIEGGSSFNNFDMFVKSLLII